MLSKRKKRKTKNETSEFHKNEVTTSGLRNVVTRLGYIPCTIMIIIPYTRNVAFLAKTKCE